MASASDFNSAWYLQQNPDVAASGMDPLQHFLNFGINEYRAPNQGIYEAATGRGAAAPYSDAYKLNMSSPYGGLLDPYKPGSSVTATLNPTTGAATFGGPGYGNILQTADAVSGYTGGASGGRPATGTATGGPFSMQPAQQQQNPFGNFDFDGYLSGLTNKFNSSLQGMTSQFDSWKNGMSGMGAGFGTDSATGKPQTPVYSPQSRNGYGSSWTNNNPFKIGSF